MTIDKNNAGIRPKSMRPVLTDIQQSDAVRLVNDPAFTRVFDTLKAMYVKDIESFDYEANKIEDEMELCMRIRILSDIKRQLHLTANKKKGG